MKAATIREYTDGVFEFRAGRAIRMMLEAASYSEAIEEASRLVGVEADGSDAMGEAWTWHHEKVDEKFSDQKSSTKLPPADGDLNSAQDRSGTTPSENNSRWFVPDLGHELAILDEDEAMWLTRVQPNRWHVVSVFGPEISKPWAFDEALSVLRLSFHDAEVADPDNRLLLATPNDVARLLEYT